MANSVWCFSVPRAQDVIKPFLIADTQAHLFDPTEARNGRGVKGRHYRRDSYRHAIQRGCEHAFGMPADLREPRRLLSRLPENERQAGISATVEGSRGLAPRALLVSASTRHNAATAIRREAGIRNCALRAGAFVGCGVGNVRGNGSGTSPGHHGPRRVIRRPNCLNGVKQFPTVPRVAQWSEVRPFSLRMFTTAKDFSAKPFELSWPN